MTPSEFKAWFLGFTEAMEGTPSEAQWKRIKARVAEIDGRAITEHVYINHYMPRYVPQWYYGQQFYNLAGATCNAIGTGTVNLNATGQHGNLSNAYAFDSHAAMLSLGRTEAQELSS